MIMNDDRTISNNGLEFITRWEGCVLTPYKDSAGLRTIGVGHLIQPGENFPDGSMITKEEALRILAKDIKKCEDAIKKNIQVELSQNQFDALCSFGFNCGTGVYSKSGVATALKSSKYNEVPAKLLDWSKASVNGVLTTLPGLYNRRKAEGDLFSMPDHFTDWKSIDLVKVQTSLKKLGLYTKKIDGILGPGTKKGIIQFAANNGVSLVSVDAGVDSSLLELLESLTNNL